MMFFYLNLKDLSYHFYQLHFYYVAITVHFKKLICYLVSTFFYYKALNLTKLTITLAKLKLSKPSGTACFYCM